MSYAPDAHFTVPYILHCTSCERQVYSHPEVEGQRCGRSTLAWNDPDTYTMPQKDHPTCDGTLERKGPPA